MSIVKFQGMTDLHAKGVNPSARIDNYAETSKKKLAEFLRVGQERDVDFFITFGDLTDSPYTSPSFINELGEILEAGLGDKPFFYVLGNHDIHSYNPSSVSQTSFGTLLRFMKNAIHLTPEPKRYTFNGTDIYLSGVDSNVRLDRNFENADGTVTPRSDAYVIGELDAPSIHVVHGYLTEKPILDSILHTPVEEMRHTHATITFAGHEHKGFGVIEGDHGLICNPGSTGRVFATRSEMRRMPQHVHGIIEDGVPRLELIPYEVARKGTEVFDMEAIEAREKTEELLQASTVDLEALMQDISLVKHVQVKDILNALKDGTTKEVFDEAERRIRNA